MAGTRLRARDYADSEDGHLFYRRYVTPMKMHSQMLSDSPEVARSRICEGGGEGGKSNGPLWLVAAPASFPPSDERQSLAPGSRSPVTGISTCRRGVPSRLRAEGRHQRRYDLILLL